MLFWLATGLLQLEIYTVRHRDMLPVFDVGDAAIITRLDYPTSAGDFVLFNLTRLAVGSEILIRRIVSVH